MSARPIEEAKLTTYVTKLIYAVFDDYEKERGLESDPTKIQTYANLCLDKKAVTKLIQRIKVPENIQQNLGYIFKQVINELKAADLQVAETYDQILAAVADSGASGYTEFAFNLGKTMKQCFGMTLHGAYDSTHWFEGRIKESVELLRTRDGPAGIVIGAFGGFLKGVAYIMGTFTSIKGVSPDHGAILVHFAVAGMSTEMLEELKNSIREKKVTPKKAAAENAETESNTELTTETTTENSNVVKKSEAELAAEALLNSLQGAKVLEL